MNIQEIWRTEILPAGEIGVYMKYDGRRNAGWELVSREFYENLEQFSPESLFSSYAS